MSSVKCFSDENKGTESHSILRCLYLSVATHCGCDCAFCGIPQVRSHSVMPLDLAEAALVGHDAGSPWEEVNITGGDPLIVPAAQEIFEKLAVHRRHWHHASVCTAGIPARPAVEGLKRALSAVPNLRVYISLDGVGALHDQIRRRSGAFAEVTHFISETRRMTADIVIATLINGLNYNSLDDILVWAQNEQLSLAFAVVNRSDFYLGNLAKVGMATLAASEAREAIDTLKRRGLVVNIDPFRPILGEARQVPCRLRSEGMFVTSDGHISVCGSGSWGVLASTRTDELGSSAWARAVTNRARVIAADDGQGCRGCSYIH